jgi:cell division protein FtsI/penicillin-binding protein 2
MGPGLYDQMRGRRRRRVRGVLAVVLVLVVGGAVAWWFLRPRVDPPEVAAAALAAAWGRGEIAAAPFSDDAPPDLAERYDALVAGLESGPPEVAVAVVAPPTEESPTDTTADLQVSWQISGDVTWEYETTAALARVEGGWAVVWSPALVHPSLTDDRRLATRRTTADRGDVLAADGAPLVTERSVVEVGVQPSRAEDVPGLATRLGELLDVDAAALQQRIEDASPDAFVAVITLREEDYLAIEEEIFPLPGTVFRRSRIPLAPTRTFARALLGSAGPVTAEMLERDPDRYRTGDVAGRSGLQAAYDERLFGTPGLQVVVAGDDPPEDPVLFEVEAEAGDPVTISLDARVQEAADAAVEGTGFATALVAVRPSDGHVLAVANSTEAGGFDLALEGRVAPGSTFKVVTTAALFAAGLGMDDTLACPASTVVDGRRITNAEDQVLGDIPFRTAFARSCNTAFVQASQQLEWDALRRAGAAFGLGHAVDIGMPWFAGDVPENESAVDLAAAAIGQGRHQVSPLAMAMVAATVAAGEYRAPALVLDPAPPASDEPGVPDLDAGAVTRLQELTRLVVTDGTGGALAGVPGGPVHGKTGTAEFGPADALRTHAWFIGFQGDLAFAVAVTDTDGAYGGQVAAPIAAAFLTALAPA